MNTPNHLTDRQLSMLLDQGLWPDDRSKPREPEWYETFHDCEFGHAACALTHRGRCSEELQ